MFSFHSQNWLNCLVDDPHCNNITKLKKTMLHISHLPLYFTMASSSCPSKSQGH
jgi:hypothetical protein